MKLLKITRNGHEEFDELFEEVETVNVEQVAPHVMEGETNVRFNGSSITEYDAVFAEIPSKNAIFGRVLLEMIEEKGVNTNYPSTGFFIMSKKNYLYNVLHEKNVPAPRTVTLASPKAGRNIEKDLEFPIIGRKFNQLVETEKQLIEEGEDVEEFLDGTEYPEEFIVFNQLERGDKYKCLYIDGDIISLADKTEEWKVSDDNLQYSNLSNGAADTVEKAAKAIGTPIAEIIMRGEQVADVNPNPDLEMYTEISGKNAHEAVAKALKGDTS